MNTVHVEKKLSGSQSHM